MTSKLKGLKITPKKRSKETNPLKIFETLTLRGTAENIWDPQSEALRSWDAVRQKKDVVIEMNTGGGKTLIGVLIAQSLVNETAGQVLYVCPTNQLIEQARMRAEECGLEVATYYEGNWIEKLVEPMGFESTSDMETKEFCGAAWPSKVLKGKRRNP